ncbi:MAG: STAS domain-containing protein [Pseudomonadota bacterium]
MEFDTRDAGDARIVTVLDERIDAAVAIRFKDAMRDAAAGAPGRVVLDLKNVAFIDSSGLGAIVATMKLLSGAHRLELASMTPVVDKVFKLTRMDKIFEIYESADAALSADVT